MSFAHVLAKLFCLLCEVLTYFKFQSLIRYMDGNYSTSSMLPFHVVIAFLMFRNLLVQYHPVDLLFLFFTVLYEVNHKGHCGEAPPCVLFLLIFQD